MCCMQVEEFPLFSAATAAGFSGSSAQLAAAGCPHLQDLPCFRQALGDALLEAAPGAAADLGFAACSGSAATASAAAAAADGTGSGTATALGADSAGSAPGPQCQAWAHGASSSLVLLPGQAAQVLFKKLHTWALTLTGQVSPWSLHTSTVNEAYTPHLTLGRVRGVGPAQLQQLCSSPAAQAVVAAASALADEAGGGWPVGRL